MGATEMSECYDVMVDIETTGVRPDRHAILQIAAVKFNYETGEVDPNVFDRCLAIPPTRSWDESTRMWWARQKPSVFQGIIQRAEDPRKVMKEFGQWCGYCHPEPLRFWAKPISFDYTFIASYFHDFQIEDPFHFTWTVDLNSFLRGRMNTTEKVKVDIPFQGDEHNALFDAIHQVKIALAAREINP